MDNVEADLIIDFARQQLDETNLVLIQRTILVSIHNGGVTAVLRLP